MLTRFACFRQSDIKALVAYSSVGHISLVFVSLSNCSCIGVQGALIIRITHGLVSSSLFFSVTTCYEFSGSRSFLLNSGIIRSLPTITVYLFLGVAFNIAAPSMALLSELFLGCSLVRARLYYGVFFAIRRFLACA